MGKKSILTAFVIISFLSSALLAQEERINLTDSEGLKTGHWIKFHKNGKVMYEGDFVKGRPVGTMKRYYEGGVLKAILVFRSGGNESYARLYYENGDLAAEGKYSGQVKDSTWNYYSFYNQRLTIKEDYSNGKKDGLSLKYYDNGKPAEIMEWKNDISHGSWEQYFENGQPRLKCRHEQGKRTGSFESFNPDGSYSITGTYKDGIMAGKWIYYKENNLVDIEVEYVDGKMLPNPAWEARQKEFSILLDESVKSLAEPMIPEIR